jgi:hypothetical protein
VLDFLGAGWVSYVGFGFGCNIFDVDVDVDVKSGESARFAFELGAKGRGLECG